MLRPYERLSKVWDAGWSDFSICYANWIQELLRERGTKQAHILDLACGTGTLAIELARRGHCVHGIDISLEMIGVARAKQPPLPALSFDVQDMVSFATGNKYDLVTCTYDSINYIRRIADLRRVFFRVASVLRPGGLFLFDSNTVHLYREHSGETYKLELEGEPVIQYCGYDSWSNVETTAFSFSDGTYEVHRQRPYSYEELEPLLERAGFNVVGLYSWFEGVPFSAKTPKLFCIAEKRKQSR